MFLLYPVATDRQPKRTPYVTYSLAGLNVLVGLWWLLVTGQDGDVLRDLAFVPAQPTVHGALTHMFMHGGWGHLLGNMLFLVLFGRNVEDAMGHVLFACSYLVCGLAAMILHLAVTASFSPADLGVSTVGASGAISGLLGLFVVRFYRTKITIWYLVFFFLIRAGTFQVSSVAAIGFWFAGQLLSGMVGLGVADSAAGGVAVWAHIGGFVFGMGYALLVGMEAEGSAEYGLGDAEQSARLESWDSAVTHAKKVLEQDPTSADAHLIAAKGYAERQDAGAATTHFLQAVDLFWEQREYGRVAETYETMTRSIAQPDIPVRQFFNIAGALIRAGSYAEASGAYERIAKSTKDPKDWEAAVLRLGQVCVQYTGELDKAKAAFEALLKRDPQSELAAHAREGLKRVEAESALGGGS